MKNLAIILFIAVLLLALIGVPVFLIVSKAPQRPLYRASYLIDRTDTFELNPTRIITEEQFTWDELKQGRNVRVRKVTNVVGEDISVFPLPTYRDWGDPSTWNFEDNELFRESRIKKFEDDVSFTLKAFAGTRTGYAHSAVMEPLIQELLHLQDYPIDDREVFVYSDLGQNTVTDNWVTHHVNRYALKTDSPHLWTALEGSGELTDLSGIKVHLIHRPKTANEDTEYRIRARYVKARLTELGAEVFIHGAINQKVRGNGN